jgi:SAM-dependent methyltransferase
MQREAHWDAAYQERGFTGVSWYQATPTVSLELIRGLGLPADAAILDVGGGASGLAEALAAEGFSDLTVLDVSSVALGELRRRLGPDAAVTLVHTDVLAWKPQRPVDLWHDRAVLHFLADQQDRDAYLERLRVALRPAGHVVVGTFSADGPERCSGLPVVRYAPDELADLLGPRFEVRSTRREEHVTPAGATQAFTWVVARYRP